MICSVFLVVQLMLESERLQLDGLHPAALLGALDQSLDLIGFEQFGQLVLRQEGVSVLSRTPVCTIFIYSMQFAPYFEGWNPDNPDFGCHKLTTQPLPPLFR